MGKIEIRVMNISSLSRYFPTSHTTNKNAPKLKEYYTKTKKEI